MSKRCPGRRTTPKSAPLFFAVGPRLHKKKPLSFLGHQRCPNESEGLCNICQVRLASTEKQLDRRAGKYIPNQETMFHGLIGEPIPPWSRLYKGAWFEEQIKAGYTLSEETLATAENLRRATYEENPKKPVEAMQAESVVQIDLTVAKTVSKKKFVVKKSVEPTTVATVATVLKKKRVVKKPVEPVELVVSPVLKKKVIRAAVPVKGFIDPSISLEEELAVKKIPVKKTEIAGKSVYLNSVKDKVYDLNFVYAGRFNRPENAIDTTYPDSDAE